MNKTESPDYLISRYLEHLLTIEDANMRGDYKAGNKEGKKVIRLFQVLEKNSDLARLVLPELLRHPSVKVRICGAAHCLSLRLYEDQAIALLNDISELSIRIFSFEARMTLSVWEKQGYLKVYPKQEIR